MLVNAAMAARLKCVDVPEDEVYDTHRPIRAHFNFSQKVRAVSKFEVPKPVVELYSKCEKERRASVARAVVEAMA
eukprot:13052824-Alexandrium_andersonii.AAC.1